MLPQVKKSVQEDWGWVAKCISSQWSGKSNVVFAFSGIVANHVLVKLHFKFRFYSGTIIGSGHVGPFSSVCDVIPILALVLSDCYLI